MAINFQPLVAESLAKQIAENIRNSILDGSLKVDDQLPTEEVLAEKFNVSRPTIREALKRLAAQNLIRSRRGPTGVSGKRTRRWPKCWRRATRTSRCA